MARTGDARGTRRFRQQRNNVRLDHRREKSGRPACTSPPIARSLPARPAMTVTPWPGLLPGARKSLGVKVEESMSNLNIEPDHPRVSFTDVFVPEDALFGEVGRGLRWRSVSCTRTGSARRRVRWELRSIASTKRQNAPRTKTVRQGAGREPGDPVAAGGTGDAGRDAAALDPQDRVGDGSTDAGAGRTRYSDRVSMCNYWANRLCREPPTAPCRSMAAWATHATSRSNTSTATTAATASPKAARKSRSARSQDSVRLHGRGRSTGYSARSEGGCACGNLRYRLTGRPMIVNACHCTWCQRETGSVHALNPVYEFDRVEHLKAEPEIIDTPSASGKGSEDCALPALQSRDLEQLSGAGAAVRFVRVGTMDDPANVRRMRTSSRRPSNHG